MIDVSRFNLVNLFQLYLYILDDYSVIGEEYCSS